MSDWRGLWGPGTDLERNVLSGSAESLLLTILSTDDVHKGLLSAEEAATLKSWIVEEKAAYFDSPYHPTGWLYPGDRSSLSFHGGDLRSRAWDMTSCMPCHGDDLEGGASDKPCSSCHEEGPMGCTTCHGDGPPPDLAWNLDPAQSRGVGAHARHYLPQNYAAIGCEDCHLVPGLAEDAGHLFDDEASKTTDLRAELSFGSRAGLGGVTPAYDEQSGTCTVYCHGPSEAPAWTNAQSLTCSSCHDLADHHGGADCTVCHQQSVVLCAAGDEGCSVVDEKVSVKFIDNDLHLDGESTIGKAGANEDCHACHGTEASEGAPAPDLHGNSDISEVTVGLHEVHLSGGSNSQPVPCESCHRVPAETTSKGHIDDDLPAEVVFNDLVKGELAGFGGLLTPTWDRASATCSETFCHSLSDGEVTQWKWTEKLPGGLTCSSCHGNPPSTTLGGGGHALGADCTICHDDAYTSDGMLDLTKHINGEVEL